MADVATLSVLLQADDQLTDTLKEAGAEMEDFGKKAGIALAATGAAILGMAALAVKGFASAGDEVHKMGLRLGISAEVLSEYKHALELSGATLGTYEMAVRKLSTALVDASEVGGAAALSFTTLKLSIRELMAMTPEQQFETVTNALADLENQTMKSALASRLFGRSGTMLLPMLAAGSAGIAEMRQQAHELGMVMDAQLAADMTDAMLNLTESFNGAKFAVAEALSPALITLAEIITNAMAGVTKFAKDHEFLSTTAVYATMAFGAFAVGIGAVILLKGPFVAGQALMSAALARTGIVAVGTTVSMATLAVAVAAATAGISIILAGIAFLWAKLSEDKPDTEGFEGFNETLRETQKEIQATIDKMNGIEAAMSWFDEVGKKFKEFMESDFMTPFTGFKRPQQKDPTAEENYESAISQRQKLIELAGKEGEAVGSAGLSYEGMNEVLSKLTESIKQIPELPEWEKAAPDTTALVNIEALVKHQKAAAASLSEYTEGTIQHTAILTYLTGVTEALEAARAKDADTAEAMAEAQNILSESLNQAQVSLVGATGKFADLKTEMEANKNVVDDLRAALSDVDAQLQKMTQVRLPGTAEFEEKQFQLEQQIKAAELAGMTGTTAARERAQKQVGGLRDDLRRMQLEWQIETDPQRRALTEKVAGIQGLRAETGFDAAMREAAQLGKERIGIEAELTGAVAYQVSLERSVTAQESMVQQLTRLVDRLESQPVSIGAPQQLPEEAWWTETSRGG